MTDGFHRSGTGPPLVLLHGATQSWRSWLPVLDDLAEHHDVLALTLPGHRGGPPLLNPATVDIQQIVDGVEKLLDEHGIEQAHFAGNSLGGWVALELLRRGRTLSVVGLSPAGAWPDRFITRRTAAAIAMIAQLGRYPIGVRVALRSARVRKKVFWIVMDHGERIPQRVALGYMGDVKSCRMLPFFLRNVPISGQCAPIDVGGLPVRIAWAEHDRTIPYGAFGAPFRERIPGAEFVRMRGVGHVPMYDDPDLVVRTILEVTNPAPSPRSGAPASRRRQTQSVESRFGVSDPEPEISTPESL